MFIVNILQRRSTYAGIVPVAARPSRFDRIGADHAVLVALRGNEAGLTIVTT